MFKEKWQELSTAPQRWKIDIKPVDPSHRRTNTKWTDEEIKFKLKRDTRLAENYPEAILLNSDFKPLYSSMNKSKIYVAPMTAKEALERKRAARTWLAKTR